MNRIEGLLINRVRKAGDKGYKLGAGYNKSYANAVVKFVESGKIIQKGSKLFATKQDRAGKTVEVKNTQPAVAPVEKKKRGRPAKKSVEASVAVETPAPAPEVVATPAEAPASTETAAQ